MYNNAGPYDHLLYNSDESAASPPYPSSLYYHHTSGVRGTDDFFSYGGEDGSILLHPDVRVIPEYGFSRQGLEVEQVELCMGLREIGNFAFDCCRDLRRIAIPCSVERIGDYAFHRTSLDRINLKQSSLVHIGHHAFAECNIKKMTIPSSVYEVPMFCMQDCKQLFSVELPREGISRIYGNAFRGCVSLRNIAFPIDADVEGYSYSCPVILQMRSALKHRFCGLPIHELCYYLPHSFYISISKLKAFIGTPKFITDVAGPISGRARLNPTGIQQDCLGMTPLHILACSTVQDLELYRIIISAYPESLIIKDKWGAIPLLYAVWGNVPSDVVQFLLESYKRKHPEYQYDWESMIETMAMAGVSLDTMENLLDMRKMLTACNDKLNWGRLLTKFAKSRSSGQKFCVSAEMFRLLFRYSFYERLRVIRIKHWRKEALKMLHIKMFRIVEGPHCNRLAILSEGLSIITESEERYNNLKESTSMLELALWKTKMNDSSSISELDNSNFRKMCRVGCGADVVIENVLPYMLPSPLEGAPSWFRARAFVLLKRNNQLAVIKEINADGTAVLEMKDKSIVSARHDQLLMSPPNEHDMVLVTGGADVGLEGELVCIDGTDTILKISDENFRIVDYYHLVKISV